MCVAILCVLRFNYYYKIIYLFSRFYFITCSLVFRCFLAFRKERFCCFYYLFFVFWMCYSLSFFFYFSLILWCFKILFKLFQSQTKKIMILYYACALYAARFHTELIFTFDGSKCGVRCSFRSVGERQAEANTFFFFSFYFSYFFTSILDCWCCCCSCCCWSACRFIQIYSHTQTQTHTHPQTLKRCTLINGIFHVSHAYLYVYVYMLYGSGRCCLLAGNELNDGCVADTRNLRLWTL